MNTNGGHLRPEEISLLVDSARGTEEIVREHPHLQSCTRCRASLVQLGRIDGALRNLPLPEPGDGFTAGVLSRIGLSPGVYVDRPSSANARAFLSILLCLSFAAGGLLLGASAGRSQPDSGAGVFVKGLLDRVGNIAVDGVGLLIGHIGAALDMRTVVLSGLGLAAGIVLATLDGALAFRFRGRMPSGR